MSGVYVHVPFCRRRCIYCDFYSVGERLAPWSDYVSALLGEARVRVPQMVVAPTTLYIGGGTPSLIPADEFARLSKGLSALTGEVGEFTIEVNPDDVTEDMARLWRGCGVNRLSMGVQSLDDGELRAICRRHDAAQARKAYEILRRHFGNISLDLMFGLPGQTVESFRRSVGGVVSMNPEHISAYSLMYEERTALTRMRDSGMIAEAAEEDSQTMFMELSEALSLAGYEQYEISNYSKPGYRSQHNSSYWRGEEYVGLGAAAHSYDGARLRKANHPDYKAYIDYWLAKKGECPAETETLSDDELREEMIMTRLRTREGLPLADFTARFGESATRRLLAAARPWLTARHLTLTPAHLTLTQTGIMISDEIILSLF